MEVIVTFQPRKYARREKWKYTETYFDGRRFPEAIVVDEQSIIGPFCKNCGYSIIFHGLDKRRPSTTCPPPNPLQSARNPMDPRPDAVRVM